MACKFQNHDNIVVDYIEERVQPSTRKKFEAHYFVCDECFKALQRMERVLWLMRHRGDSIFAEN
jgi:hypothetical protein